MFAIFFLGFFIAGLVRMFNDARMPFCYGMLCTGQGQAALGTFDAKEVRMWFTCRFSAEVGKL